MDFRYKELSWKDICLDWDDFVFSLGKGYKMEGITMTRKRLPDGALYFGPYSSTSTVFTTIAQLERTLGIPTCKKKFPEDIGKDRPCVYYQIGRCMGVCTGEISAEEYRSEEHTSELQSH